jgi:PAS domain S-box-containing protein
LLVIVEDVTRFGQMEFHLTQGRNEMRLVQEMLAHTNAELQASRERYQELYENTPVMNFSVDEAGIVLAVNRFGAAELGYTPQDLIGESVLKVFQAENHPIVLDQLRECFQNPDKTLDWELRKIRRDRSRLAVHEIARVMPDGNGKPILLIACQNITVRKQAEEALVQLTVSLDERVR